ncbi:hypothetical protein X551_03762 [Methylibium sp. T29]|nr:hypothetical protein [Methylibium sp. T29-B]EWS53439.1 hypothetical protein X551_03762 [Methylibium sp. T29]EWS60033.1 hypothetical protein Y694_02175 [Methylibium sp. T29-B]
MLRDTSPTAIVLNGQAADDKRVAVIYRCRLKPEQLTETDHPDIKFCDQCQQKVFKITDFDGFEKAVASKGCVWGLSTSGRPPIRRKRCGSSVGRDSRTTSQIRP